MSDPKVVHEWTDRGGEFLHYRVFADGYMESLGDAGWVYTIEDDAAAKELARLASSRRWIPVGERLPENREDRVLVLMDDGSVGVAWDILRLPVDKYLCSSWDDRISSYDAVTHWMPLPEPPE